MKRLIAIVFFGLLWLFLFGYVGLYLCLFGGLVQFIDQIRLGHDMETVKLVWGLVRFFITGPVLMVSIWICMLGGVSIVSPLFGSRRF